VRFFAWHAVFLFAFRVVVAVARGGGVVSLDEREIIRFGKIFAKCGGANSIGQEVVVFWFDGPGRAPLRTRSGLPSSSHLPSPERELLPFTESFLAALPYTIYLSVDVQPLTVEVGD
jgi:hypothetical protein